MKLLKNLWVAISGIALMALVVATGLLFMYFVGMSVYIVLENLHTITDGQFLSLIGWCLLVYQPYKCMLLILKYVTDVYEKEKKLQELMELVDVGISGGF